MKLRFASLAGGSFCLLASLLHVLIILGGPDWYRFFGAGEEMAQMAARGDAYPAVITSFISLILLLWGLYGYSAAGFIRPLPLLRPALLVIAIIFLARGLLAIPLLFWTDDHLYLQELASSMTFMMISSAISVGAGLCYLISFMEKRQQPASLPGS